MPPNTTQTVPIMPIVLVLLLLLPVRLHATQLRRLAFLLWLSGGAALIFRGVAMMGSEPAAPGILLAAGAAALVIGAAKGRFVLSKTAKRNVERLETLTEPQRPVGIYSLRSWIMISVMVGISVALNYSGITPLWRGAINLGIGAALFVSSLSYLYYPTAKKTIVE